jgi:hypothetical protein
VLEITASREHDTARHDHKSAVRGEARNNSSKINERRTNVYENKGPVWETSGQSRNVIENKTTYWSYPGMLLKAK